MRSTVGAAFFAAIMCLAALAVVSCGGRGVPAGNLASPTAPASASNPGTPQGITVSVSPVSALLPPGVTQQFTALVSGTTNTAVTWSAGGVNGGNATVGTISASGLYTAPATIPTPSEITITAVSTANSSSSGTAMVDVHIHHDNQDAQNAPIKMGTSGGNKTDQQTSGGKLFCCSGTLGSLVSRGGKFYILSNNHVLDKSGQGTPGDPISQPGLADTNCGEQPNMIVGNLTQAAPLGSSNVDAAIAQIASGQVDTSGSVLDLAAVGQPAAPSSTVAAPAVGQPVAKSGDATGLTCSSVEAINATVRVDYSTACGGGSTFTETFSNQIAISGSQFSSSGDSGSLIVTSDTARPVALLFAGSDTATVGSPISAVLGALQDPGTSEVPKMVGGADHAVACPAGSQDQIAATQRKAASNLPQNEIDRATAARNRYAEELLADPAVSRIDIGRSDDNPAEPAVILTVTRQPQNPIPVELDGVRTKIVFAPEAQAQTNTQTQSAISGIFQSELARARAAKESHAHELMSLHSVLGVGVGASTDSPGEGAVVVFVEKGSSVSVPAAVDGVRTKIIVSEPFRTFTWGRRTVKSCSRAAAPAWNRLRP